MLCMILIGAMKNLNLLVLSFLVALSLLPSISKASRCWGDVVALHRLGKFQASNIEFKTTHSYVRGYNIKGDGPTVISIHGFSGDASNMLEFGRQLNLRANYNFVAINALDHGQGLLRSKGRTLGRSKLPMAMRDAQDMYEIIEQEFKRTGQQVFISGHSRGGMQQDLLAMAVDVHEGNYFINKEKFKKLQEMVRGAVLLAAPAPRNEGISETIIDKALKNNMMNTMAWIGKIDAPVLHSQNPFEPIEAMSFSEVIFLNLISSVAAKMKTSLDDTSIANVRMMSLDEVKRFALHGSSGAHGKQMQELGEMMDPKGFQFRGVDLMDVEKEYAFPVLRVVGSMDRIGKAEGTASLAEDNIARAKLFGQEVVVVKEASHLDVLNEAAVDSYIGHVIKFFDEGSIGSSQVRYASPVAPRLMTIRKNLKSLRVKTNKTIEDLDQIDLLVAEREVIKGGVQDTQIKKAVAELTNNGLISITEIRADHVVNFASTSITNAKKVIGRDLKLAERQALRRQFKAAKAGDLVGFDAIREALIADGFKSYDAERLVISGIL
jgi:pimeloyl-ACP methyl ester carboxylesterase